MKRLCIAALLPLIAANAPRADRVSEADLRDHITVLASDAFEGRAPGTDGGARAVEYIAGQFSQAGLSDGAGAGGWFQPIALVERTPLSTRFAFAFKGKPLEIDPDDLVLRSAEPVADIEKAPVLFLGYGDNPKSLDPAGAVAIILQDAPDGPDISRRRDALLKRGARAVIAIVGGDFDIDALGRNLRTQTTMLASTRVSGVDGYIALEAASVLTFAAGRDISALIERATRPQFAGESLGITADLHASTDVRAYDSYNVIGRIKGTDPKAGAVLLTAHWDHLGICRDESAKDRICNGAIDNASGVALLIEVARHLAHGPPLHRSVYFMATTAEERGLLGAYGFIAKPVTPLKGIRAVLNVDTVAVAGRGAMIAVVGKGTRLDQYIARAAAIVGREVDPDNDADLLLERQDGWAFSRQKIPAVMIGGTFSDMARAQKYLQGTYHGPDDALTEQSELGGAAEDATLHVVLARMLANAKDLG